jgi:glycosyltransferase involved in cell wall biosynthesis
MRVLIVTHAFVINDGQGRVNYEIVRAALAAGHSVTLVGSQAAPALLALPRVRFVQIPASRLPTRLLQYQMFALKSALWIRRHRAEFDVIHVNGFITWARADVNTVHFVHDGWYRCGFYPFRIRDGAYPAYQVLYTRLNAWCEKRALRRARVVVPVSLKVAAEVRSLGIGDERMQVIHNGVDVTEFAPGAAERARFGLPEAPFMLLFAGDLRLSRKNLDAVLRALVSMPPHVHLAVAGALRNSPYPALAQTLGVAERVHFVEFVKDMPALMRSVDAFVVTAATAGGAEVIDDDCGVVLGSPEDVAGLAAAVTRLASDPAYAGAMGRAARERAQTLSWQNMATRYLSLYEELCARRVPQLAPVGGFSVSTET